MALNRPSVTPQPSASTTVTARVVRSDATGVWAVPIGTDTRHPIGPCAGAHRPGTTGPEQLPVGALVLLVFTNERPWIAGWEDA